MTRKRHTSARREIAQPSLWQTSDAPRTPWQEWIEAQLRLHGRADVSDELLAWLGTQVEELASCYPECFEQRKQHGEKAAALFCLSGAPVNDDEAACFGHWPSAGIISPDGTVGIAIDLPEGTRQVKGSRLIDVIVKGAVSERYFISKHAARGILRRCALMKRPLFPPLSNALEILARKDERERENKGEER
jgi:hypothetical protein